MLMKIVTSVVAALLVAAVSAGAVFYLKSHKPLATDYALIKAALPAYEKANAELKKLQEKERRETAWMGPAVEALNTGLGNEIKAGKAEVFVTDRKVIINIAEQELFLPGSYTFAKESPQLRLDLATLLKSDALKGRNISIGNTTRAVPAQGKGRKKVPAKDARKLAAERSAVLVKDLEKNSVDPDALIAAAFSAKQPAIGFKIKEQKTILIIENPPMVQMAATQQEAASPAPAKPAPDAKSAMTMTVPAAPPISHARPKPVPIQPAQPKTQ